MSRFVTAVLLLFSILVSLAKPLSAQQVTRGHVASVTVADATRLDWAFALANQSPKEPPADWTRDYDSKKQTYELYVPQQYDSKTAWPVVLFVSPGDRGAGFQQWQQTLQKRGIIFASPHQAGNNCPMPRRVRIVMDVLDDLRRNYNIDPDRVYIGGFSGGGRVACAIAFALPEYFGGVIPVCAGGDLRDESWLRQRVIDRLSVAQLTGETDFNRGEVERMHQTELSAVGVRCNTWVTQGLGHGIPNAEVFAQSFDWLEETVEARRRLATQWPASRIADAPSRDQWADRLLAEGKQRLANPATIYSGLMQIKGVYTRWNDLTQAKSALELLSEFDQKPDRPWENDDIAEQRRFLIARARGIDAYASGPLPKQYEPQKEAMLKAAIQLWSQVIEDGQDEIAVAEARQRIPKLEAIRVSE
jgi:pimeloyl-ACP methyl ester carboxylesterase